MPIHKERLEALLIAAQYIEHEHIRIASQTEFYATEALEGDQPQSVLREALTKIQLLNLRPSATIYQQSEIINEERVRWKFTHKKAEREKRYQQARRERQGIKPRSASQTYNLNSNSSDTYNPAEVERRSADDAINLQGMNNAIHDLPEWPRASTDQYHRPYATYKYAVGGLYFCSCDNENGFEMLTDLQLHLQDVQTDSPLDEPPRQITSEDIVEDL